MGCRRRSQPERRLGVILGFGSWILKGGISRAADHARLDKPGVREWSRAAVGKPAPLAPACWLDLTCSLERPEPQGCVRRIDPGLELFHSLFLRMHWR
jgi:hypothetical protein